MHAGHQRTSREARSTNKEDPSKNRVRNAPVHVHEAALVVPRVESEALCSADRDERLPISVVERHRGDREGSFVVDCRASTRETVGFK